MGIDEEMKSEISRLEKELKVLEDEIKKINERLMHIMMLKKKKERDLKILKANFGEYNSEEKNIQTTLYKMLEERMKKL